MVLIATPVEYELGPIPVSAADLDSSVLADMTDDPLTLDPVRVRRTSDSPERWAVVLGDRCLTVSCEWKSRGDFAGSRDRQAAEARFATLGDAFEAIRRRLQSCAG